MKIRTRGNGGRNPLPSCRRTRTLVKYNFPSSFFVYNRCSKCSFRNRSLRRPSALDRPGHSRPLRGRLGLLTRFEFSRTRPLLKHNLCLCWAVYRLYTGTPAIAGHENVLCHESLGMTRGKKVHFQSDPRGNRKGHGRLPRPGLCQWPQAGDSAQPANQGWTFFHPWGAGAQWGGPGAFLRTRTIRNQGGRPVAPKTRPG